MSKTYTLSQITARLGGQVRGADTAVSAVQPLDKAEAADISFLANPKYKHEVHASGAGAVIVSEKAAAEFEGRSLIVAADPYLYFAKVARLFSPVVKAAGGVHPTAVIEPSATVPASCEIGANVYIGANTVLGEGCRILAGAVVEHDCTLGDETVVRANAVIYYGCTLGKRVEIHSGAVIGADGFGLAFAGDSWFKIPQTGAVTLGDDVEIGSNTNIDRGAMSDTTVGCGTKIDNQVQIGHNCKIGSHTVIAAKTGISGSVTIGNYCIIGGGTSVTHSITESGTHVAGIFPMSSYRDWARNAVHIHRLNDTAKRIRQLEQQLAELKNGK